LIIFWTDTSISNLAMILICFIVPVHTTTIFAITLLTKNHLNEPRQFEISMILSFLLQLFSYYAPFRLLIPLF
jgi:hypothetical protein